MPRKLKILICGILPPPNFGHSMMYKMLIESSFIKAHETTFLNLHFWTYGTHKKITFRKIAKLIKYLFQYKMLILMRRPQYVLYNMSFDKMPFLKDYLFCLTGKMLGCKIILHDMGQYLPELYANSGKFYQRLIRHMLKMTTAIIVMGQKVKEEYKAFVPQKRLIVVPGTVEETAHLVVPLIPRTNPEEIRVLYFSFLSVSKGVWTAIHAIPEVVKSNPKVSFTFAGPVESPQLLAEIKEYIAHNGLTDRFNYVGYVEGVEQRTSYFRSTDIFIFPTHRDVFGLVILHAMAEGIPIIASREGTIPEIIEDERSGLLFEKGNAKQLAGHILRLAAHSSDRRRMAAASEERFKAKFAPHQYGISMIEAFEHIQNIK